MAAKARKFLTVALAEYRRLGVIPNFRRLNRWQRYEGPWPPWGAWFQITDREASSAGFVAALRAAYPTRFGEVSAHMLIRRLVGLGQTHERAVARRVLI